jgi:hypothetical protein
MNFNQLPSWARQGLFLALPVAIILLLIIIIGRFACQITTIVPESGAKHISYVSSPGCTYTYIALLGGDWFWVLISAFFMGSVVGWFTGNQQLVRRGIITYEDSLKIYQGFAISSALFILLTGTIGWFILIATLFLLGYLAFLLAFVPFLIVNGIVLKLSVNQHKRNGMIAASIMWISLAIILGIGFKLLEMYVSTLF